MVFKKLFAIVLTVTIVCALLPKVNSQELEAANEMNMNMNMKKRHNSENDLIEDAGDLSEESQFFSPKGKSDEILLIAILYCKTQSSFVYSFT